MSFRVFFKNMAKTELNRFDITNENTQREREEEVGKVTANKICNSEKHCTKTVNENNKPLRIKQENATQRHNVNVLDRRPKNAFQKWVHRFGSNWIYRALELN